MLAKVLSLAIIGLDALPVEVEVDVASGHLPSFTIVGLADKAVQEAKERVIAALKNSGATFPVKRITVNLAPADVPKEGPRYDLPIALGILIASEQLKANTASMVVCGELSLTGSVRKTNGILSLALMAKQYGITNVFVPAENASEAVLIDGISLYPVRSLAELIKHLTGSRHILPQPSKTLADIISTHPSESDMQDIKGQHRAKRALEIAAAGGHNMLLKGPPGSGKTLLARTLPSILPDFTFAEMLEVTKIYSIANMLNNQPVMSTRPFRSPHHTISLAGLIGGSTNPRPGEITLAHRGVLFLDEFPEFPRHILEGLRQPIEDGIVTISRANGKITFPAQCMLVAAQNPCPCGYLGDKTHTCQCSPIQINRYQKRISGPLLDRIDMHIDVPAIKVETLAANTNDAEGSAAIKKRVQSAREKQIIRYKSINKTNNAELTNREVKQYCVLSPECLTLLKKAVSTFGLSGRAYHRLVKLSRTIADLAGEEHILPKHIAESLQYRPHV